MACTEKRQLLNYPKVRVQKKWFRYFNDHKDFHNEGNLHLFSLMALYSYANYRTNKRRFGTEFYLENPGQWICKLSSLPRILRVHSKAQTIDLLEYFKSNKIIDYEFLDLQEELLRFTICNWTRHCVHLEYSYYSYKGSGFFFFPLPAGRELIAVQQKTGKVIFSELDAIMDFWLHTVLNEPRVAGSEYMPVVYFSNMKGQPLLSYSYLARRWGWSKSRVGRFILKIEEAGIISRVSFSSSRGSVISPCRYREMIYGECGDQIQLQRIGEILGIADLIEQMQNTEKLDLKVESRVPPGTPITSGAKSLRIQVFRHPTGSFFARPVPLVFYSSLDWGELGLEEGYYRGLPKQKAIHKGG